MSVQFILLVFAAYLFGSIPTAYLVAKWRRGIDIRKFGSGNVGASNVLATVSKIWSIPVTLFDISKSVLMMLLAQQMGLGAAQQATVGIAAVIGHNWTVFLRFNGGRGIFTTLGVIAILSPKVGLIALVVAYSFAPFRQLALGVTIALLMLPALALIFSETLGVAEPQTTAIAFAILLIVAMLRRLTVPRTTLSATVSTGELIINRLLFDRDIKDRKTWVTQTREMGKGE